MKAAQQMQPEELQNAARRCFAVNTTAMCHGCLRDLKERIRASPVGFEFRVESASRGVWRGVWRGVRLAGRLAGRLAQPQAKPHKNPGLFNSRN